MREDAGVVPFVSGCAASARGKTGHKQAREHPFNPGGNPPEHPGGTPGNDRMSSPAGGGPASPCVGPSSSVPPHEAPPPADEDITSLTSLKQTPSANRLTAERFGDLALDFILELDEGWAYGAARCAARFGLASLKGA